MGTKSEVIKQSGLRIMDNLELYQEEQRQALIDMNKGIAELSTKVQQQIDAYEVVKNVEVTGRVEVNTEKEIAVSNLEDLQDSIESLEGTLSKAIKDNSYKPLESVTVKNIKDAVPTELKITNLSDIAKYFNNLEQSIKNNQPIVNVAKQDIAFPTDPKKPIAVRLSDGKKFYEAITAAVGGGGGGGSGTSFKDTTGKLVYVELTADGSIPVTVKNSLTPNVDFDYIDIQQTSATVETYVYKQGGVSGTTVQTITVTYTDSTKNDLDKVEYS